MSTWTGWRTDLLSALGVKDTAGNRAFLAGWAKTSGTSCADNPLAATLAASGSRHCTHVAGSIYVQAYPSKKAGIAATVRQLDQPDFKSILGALESGNPILYPDWQLVVGELGIWGAHAYAVQYGKAAQAAQAPVPSGGGISSDASRSLAGYKHFAHQLSHTIPEQLRRSQHLRAQALAKLRH